MAAMTTTHTDASADTDADLRAERRSRYHEADVVVVGAGVFGCAIAYALAERGRSVLLLERWMHEPDRIVGELLQPGGVAALRALGLGSCLEGIDAVSCHGYHVLYHGEDVVIPYPRVETRSGRVKASRSPTPAATAASYVPEVADGSAEKKKMNGAKKSSGSEEDRYQRPEGQSFHHGRFIMQLRRACLGHANITVVETEVTATIRGQHTPEVLGVESRTTDAATGAKRPDCFFGQLTIIADGYASKFRRELLGRDPVVKSRFYALELQDCPFPPQGFGHVVIGQGFPVLLYQIGARETRALIDVPLDLPAASPARGGVRGYIRSEVLPGLPEAVRPSVEAALADGRIPRSMPNSWLPPAQQTTARTPPGVVVLGDAFNMRHPLTGGGMTVALHDALLLADLLPAGPGALADHAAVRDAMRTFHWRRKRLTSIINVLAQALYALFAAGSGDRQLRALQRGCFAYFQRGITDEPMGLLGGLIHDPWVLAYHFFSVAFVGIWLDACDVVGSGSPLLAPLRLPLALVHAVLILWRACVVFLPVLWTELR